MVGGAEVVEHADGVCRQQGEKLASIGISVSISVSVNASAVSISSIIHIVSMAYTIFALVSLASVFSILLVACFSVSLPVPRAYTVCGPGSKIYILRVFLTGITKYTYY